jgi:hypothetical protein
MKTQPLLESALESLETALHSRDKDDVKWHIEDAIDDLKEAIAQAEVKMTRSEFLDWTLEKNGLAEAMELLRENELPTKAMQRALNEREAN